MIHTNSASVSIGVEGGCRLNLAVSNCVSMAHTAWWLIPCATTCSSTWMRTCAAKLADSWFVSVHSPSGDKKRRERGVGGLVQMAGLLT